MDFFDELISQLQQEAAKKDSFTVSPREWEKFLGLVDDEDDKTVPPVAEPETAAVKNAPAVVSEMPFDLHLLQQEILDCKACPLVKMRKNPALSCGDVRAKLMIVIENPSLLDDEEGSIFAGEVGLLLDKMLLAMGLKRSETYVTAVVKCRTPGNRPPAEDELNECSRRFFIREVKAVRPDCILAFGAGFAKNMLNRRGTISELRGKFDSFEGIPVMSTFNPAYLLRQPSAKKVVWGDLQMVMKALGLPK